MLGVLLLATVPLSPITETRVDVVEENHFYDECGQHVFTQFIFWEWDNSDCRLHVVAWRLQSNVRGIRGRGTLVWNDGDVFRRVRFGEWRETWTQFDPEYRERETRPKESRRELGR